MTGPHLLAAVAYDEYYSDTMRMIADFGKLLHQNFRRLADAGCKHLQIDEPYFTVADDQEVRAAVDAINIAVEGLPEDFHVMVHICQGNYAVGPDYDGHWPPLFRPRPLQGRSSLRNRVRYQTLGRPPI